MLSENEIIIHKSQGLTLDTCVIAIGSSVFSFGQVYVALSRVKCLDGLHVINLTRKCLLKISLTHYLIP